MMAWILTLPMLVAQAASDPAVTDAVAQGAQTAATATPSATAAGLSGLVKLLIAVAIIAGSFGLGHGLARWLRLSEYSFKLGLILLSALSSAAICYFGRPVKLGIDLSGGVVLVYEVEGSATNAEKLQDLADAVSARLNLGRKEKIFASVENGRIELTLPAGADVGTVENRVASLRGEGLNLAAASKREVDGATILVYEPDQTFQRVDMDKLVAAVNRRINPGGFKEVTVRQYGAESLEVIIPEVEQSEVELIKGIISTSGALEFRILANPREPEHRGAIERAMASPLSEVVNNTPDGRVVVAKWVNLTKDIGGEAAVMREKPSGQGAECLVMIDLFNVTGQYLRRASEGIDQSGRKSIDFSFNSEGAQLFGALTGANVPDPASGLAQRLGIVLDNDLISAPTLQSQIRDQGQITGSFEQNDIDRIVNVLNAGSLPTALHKIPIQEQRISAQLGADTVEQGSRAMLISSIGVILFMLIYYRFAGAVADGAVILNLLMAVAGMILIKAAFTLPGLAGLVLTLGMAVDANVLIYERMREEQKRGASLRMAIRNGYSRAFSTIIDSHVTTIATGIVLFAIGSDQIKGFAVTLILGLLVSLYTSVYVTRVVFDVFEKNRWLIKLNMMQWFRQTNIDFMRLMRPAAMVSLIVICVGLVGVLARGKDLLDIDFIGGSSVQIQFKSDQPQDIAEVRKVVSVLPDTTVSAVGINNLEYKLDTSQPDVNQVRDILQDAFAGKLNTYSMTCKNIRPFQARKKAEAPLPAETKLPLTADKEPAAEAPKPETTDPETPKADETKTDETKTDETKTDETKTDETKTEETKTDETKAETPSTDHAPGEPALSDAGTSADLQFSAAINHATLRDRVNAQLKAQGLEGTYFELTNPEYTTGSSSRYSNWTINILLPQGATEKLVTSMEQKLSSEAVFPAANQIGGKVAGKTKLAAIYAILASLVIIIVYVWIRFQNVLFGLAAVVALIHDVLVALGFIALSYWMSNNLGMEWLLVDPFKISLAVVAALLTIVGYSINDTIVIFDRIREIRGKSLDLTGKMINQAVNETLSRTFITSGTVFIATTILYVFGGAGIHPFAFAMLIGVISGTYSTIFIAAPILLLMKPPSARPGTTRAANHLSVTSSRP